MIGPVLEQATKRRGRKDTFRSAVLLLVSLLIVAVSIASQVSLFAYGKAALASWRETSRNANKAVFCKDYDLAISDYRKAIVELQAAENPDVESMCDLKLSLAEVYRRDGKLEQAQCVLDEVGPKITSGGFDDPFLAARYWRRRASLEASQGRRHLCANSYRHLLDIMGKYYYPNCGSYAFTRAEYLEILCDNREWGTALAQLRKMHADYGTVPGIKRVKQALDFAYERFSAASIDLVKAGNMDGAGRLLCYLTEMNADDESLLVAWKAWFNYCCAETQGKNDTQELDSLARLLKALGPSTSKRANSLRVMAKLCMIEIYQRQGKTQIAEDQLGDLCRMQVVLGPDDLWLWSHLNSIGGARLSNNLVDNKTGWLLEQMVRVTALSDFGSQKNRSLITDHCHSLVLLSKFFEKRHDCVKAINTLSLITPEMIQHTEPAAVWQCKLHLRYGSVFEQMGKASDARVHLALAKRFCQSVPSDIRQPLERKIEEVSERLISQPDRSLSTDKRGAR